MRTLAAIALSLSALSANAETVTLVPDGTPILCGAQRYCNAVPNDAGLNIFVASPQAVGPNLNVYPPTSVVVDGVAYSGQMTTPGNYFVFSGPVTNSISGNVATLTIAFHVTVRRVGRTSYTSWYIDSGTLILN